MVPDHTPARYRAGVIGHPIAHSKSPLLHRAAYAFLGFDCSYTALDTSPASLEDRVAQVRADAAWRGLSVTMPHKAASLALMDELGPSVAALGVINTVCAGGEGEQRRLVGYNTDIEGIVRAVRHAGAGSPKQAVVLGGGGTASAALAALARMGAERVHVCVRSPQKAEPLAELGHRLGISVELNEFGAAAGLSSGSSLVISTLPPHGADELAGALVAAAARGEPRLRRHFGPRVLLDVAYDPWPSDLAQAWSSLGGVIVPGLEMLLYQAVEQVKLFAGDIFREESAVINVMCDAVGAPRR
ncbi:shikimate dehydrogenase [Arthrobacter tumbae]|uniref:shikimate dehydrogenase family protein n=1 Tax=Arthrobacter tumbae TaxID=163874 RepID=UPI001956C018|nr:shikimate dehydrogenase [Arthrobacter tumbae]MBM7783216.1 shikimate dehydrogenase [Arthrobacter tumbae]